MAGAGVLLSVVVVCHEMARELPRTVLSLCPPYQRGIDPSEVEVIVVDNGSSAMPDLSGLQTGGMALRVVRAAVSSASPVGAANQGVGLARADLVGVWIDGARLASPGLLAAALAAARGRARPVIATVNHQLGPERQCLSVDKGYDHSAEDALLASVGWPADGYRLFDIATPEVADPLASPLLESNALFLRRAMWDELGGYDPAFDMPGGGMANPDLFIRACGLPAADLIRLAGEGTFHQVHGGVTTSSLASAVDEVKRGAAVYRALRGRPLAPVRRPMQVFWAGPGAVNGVAAAQEERA